MKQKNILLLGCSHKQVEYAKYLYNNSFNLIIVDKSLVRINDTKFVHIKTSYDNTDSIINNLIDLNINPDIIFTAADQISLIYCCEISEKLNIKFRLKKNLAVMINTKFKFYDNFVRHGLNIPETEFHNNRESLIASLSERVKSGNVFYVKSDYSKNPRYVYRIESLYHLEKVNWVKDRYLKEGYVAQPLIDGICYRINLFNDKCIVFDFETNKLLQTYPDELKKYIDNLRSFVFSNELKNEVVKFDVIFNEKDGTKVLDIGLDPPLRLIKHCYKKNINFVEAYCELGLGNSMYMNKLFNNVIQPTN